MPVQGDGSSAPGLNPVRPLRALQVEGVCGKLEPRLRNGDVVAVGGPVVGIRRRRNAERDRSAGRGRRGRRSRGPRNGTHGTTGRDRHAASAACWVYGEGTTRRRCADQKPVAARQPGRPKPRGSAGFPASKLSAAGCPDSARGWRSGTAAPGPSRDPRFYAAISCRGKRVARRGPQDVANARQAPTLRLRSCAGRPRSTDAVIGRGCSDRPAEGGSVDAGASPERPSAVPDALLMQRGVSSCAAPLETRGLATTNRGLKIPVSAVRLRLWALKTLFFQRWAFLPLATYSISWGTPVRLFSVEIPLRTAAADR